MTTNQIFGEETMSMLDFLADMLGGEATMNDVQAQEAAVLAAAREKDAEDYDDED